MRPFAPKCFFSWSASAVSAKRRIKQSSAPVVSDYLLEKDKLFAYINLDNEELKLYERYYPFLTADIPTPDLVIYLQASPEILRERIVRKRARRKPASPSSTWRKWCAPTSIFFFAIRRRICSS